jgi:hypothetical protein
MGYAMRTEKSATSQIPDLTSTVEKLAALFGC